jgi:riboflavin synthase alpha subunit
MRTKAPLKQMRAARSWRAKKRKHKKVIDATMPVESTTRRRKSTLVELNQASREGTLIGVHLVVRHVRIGECILTNDESNNTRHLLYYHPSFQIGGEKFHITV